MVQRTKPSPYTGIIKLQKIKDIVAYLQSDVKYKKFLTTPRGLEKIKMAMAQTGKAINKALYSRYFLLVDECHKWVKDTGFREDMIPPMNDFFFFKKKAMISATVIPFSDPRFKLQKFRHILLKPTYAKMQSIKWFREEPVTNPLRGIKQQLTPVHPYKKDINLLQVNSITNGLKDYIQRKSDDTFCIFFNSISGIKSLIADLDILAKSRIFCSSESSKLLQLEQAGYNVSDEFKENDNTSLLKYNFFTSSFYTGLDIKLTFKPNIVILTDSYNAPYSIVDPYTDVPQIIGRFRNDKYQEVVHIHDYSKFTNFLSEKELEKLIDCSQKAYAAVDNLVQLTHDEEDKVRFRALASRLHPFATFIDQNGAYSAFKEDNYRNENRVKRYYNQAYMLRAAYQNTNYFNLISAEEVYEKDELIKLKKSAGKYSQVNNLMAAEALEELETIKGTAAYIHYVDSIDRMFPIIVDAFKRFGLFGLKHLKFRIKAIKKYIILQDVLEKKNSFPMIDLVYETFQTGRSYTRAHIKATLQSLYDYIGLDARAKAIDIDKYYAVKYHNAAVNGKSNNSFVLVYQKYNRKPGYTRI